MQKRGRNRERNGRIGSYFIFVFLTVKSTTMVDSARFLTDTSLIDFDPISHQSSPIKHDLTFSCWPRMYQTLPWASARPLRCPGWHPEACAKHGFPRETRAWCHQQRPLPPGQAARFLRVQSRLPSFFSPALGILLLVSVSEFPFRF